MKKSQILTVLCLIPLLLCNCNKWEDEELFDDLKTPEETYLPTHVEEYGKAIATELNRIVINLNKTGVDYSNANGTAAFKEQFFNDINNASPTNTKSGKITPVQMSPKVFAERVNNLTKIQLEFISKIIKECDNSKTYPELAKRLINVNKDIHSDVPEIQQERLFTITAVLYYGIKEIQNLEKQGLMLRTHRSKMQYIRLKSGGIESGDDNLGANCRKFLATTWAIAIGEPTPFGEIVATVASVIVGGILLYEIVVCASNVVDCNLEYYDCVQNDNMPDWKCTDCLRYCQGQNVWDCPRPY